MSLKNRRKVMLSQSFSGVPSKTSRRSKETLQRNKNKHETKYKKSVRDNENSYFDFVDSNSYDCGDCGGADDNPSSWDTMSEAEDLQEEVTGDYTDPPEEKNKSHDLLSTLQITGCAQNIPSELPLLCNIAQKVFREADGAVEVVVFDMDVAPESSNEVTGDRMSSASERNLHQPNSRPDTVERNGQPNNSTECNAIPLVGEDLLRTDICLLPENQRTDEGLIPESTVADNRENERHPHDHVHYTLRIIKSKSYDNLIQGSDILRDCHTAVPYDQVIKKKFCLDKVLQVEKDYSKTFSDVKQEQIGDLPTLKDAKDSYKRTSSACSILQKYIYLEEPFKLKKEQAVKHQTIECHILSTGLLKNKSPQIIGKNSAKVLNSSKETPNETGSRKGKPCKNDKSKTEGESSKTDQKITMQEISQSDASPNTPPGSLVFQRQLQLGLASETIPHILCRDQTPTKAEKSYYLPQFGNTSPKPTYFEKMVSKSTVHVDENLLRKGYLQVASSSVQPWIGHNIRDQQVLQIDPVQRSYLGERSNLLEALTEKRYHKVGEEENLDEDIPTTELDLNVSSYQLPWENNFGNTIAGEAIQTHIIPENSTPLTRAQLMAWSCESIGTLGVMMRELAHSRLLVEQSESNLKHCLLRFVRREACDQMLVRVVEMAQRQQADAMVQVRCAVQNMERERSKTLCALKERFESQVLALARQKQVLELENVQLQLKLENSHNKEKLGEDTLDTPMQNSEIINKLAKTQSNLSEIETLYIKLLHHVEQCSQEIHSLKLKAESQRFLHLRYEADTNIEKELLLGELEERNKIMKSVSHLADALISDLENIRNSLSSSVTCTNIKWERLKGEACSISINLEICRSCIQELGLALLHNQQNLEMKEREQLNVLENCHKLEQVLYELDIEYNKLRQQSESVICEKISMEKKLLESSKETESLKDQLSKCSMNTSVLENEIDKMNEIKTAVREQELIKSQLEKNIQELAAEKNSVVQKLLEEKQTEQTMELDLVKMTAAVDMYEASNRELLKNNNVLKSKLESTQKSLQNLESFPKRYEDLQNDYHKELAENDYLNQENSLLKTELSKLQDMRDSLSKDNSKLNDEIKTLSKEDLENKWEIKSLKDVNKCLEHDNCNMLKRLEDETLHHQVQINEMQVSNQKLQSTILDKDKDVEELKKILLVQSETMCSLQKECDEKRDVISKLEERCLVLDSAKSKEETQTIVFKAKVQELENTIVENKQGNANTIESMRYEFDSLETTLKITQDDLNNTIVKLQEKESSLKITQDNLRNVESTLQQKQQEIKELTKEIKILEKNIEECSQIKASNVRMQHLLKDHDNMLKEWNKLKEYQNSIQIENESLRQNLKIFQNRYETLNTYYIAQKEHMKKLKYQLFTLQDNLNKIEVSNKTLLAEIQQVTYEGLSNKHSETQVSCITDDSIGTEKQDEIEEKTLRLQSQVKLLHELHKRNSNELVQSKRSVVLQEERIRELSVHLEGEVGKRNILEREHEMMHQKQKTLLAKIEELQGQVNKEAHTCLSLTEEYYSHEKENSEKEFQHQQMIEKLQKNLQESKSELKSAIQKQEETQMTLEEKQLEINAVNEKNHELESRFSEYGRTLTHLADEKRRSDQLSAALAVAQAECAGQRALATAAAAAAEAQREALQGAVADARRLADAAARRADEQQLLSDGGARLLTDAKEQLAKCIEEKSHLAQELESLKINKEQIEQSYNELQQEKHIMENRIQKLSQKLLRALKEVFDTKAEFQVANEKMVELSNQIKNLNEQKVQKCGEVASLSSEIVHLNLQLQQRSDETSRCESTEEDLRQESTRLKAQVGEMQEQLMRRKHKAHAEIAKLEELLLIKDDTIAQCTEKMHFIQEQGLRLTKRLSEAQEQLLSQRQDQRTLECQIMRLQAEKRDLSLQLIITEGLLEEEKQHTSHLQNEHRGE